MLRFNGTGSPFSSKTTLPLLSRKYSAPSSFCTLGVDFRPAAVKPSWLSIMVSKSVLEAAKET